MLHLPLSLINRLKQTESAVFKLWMLYFQRISVQIIYWNNVIINTGPLEISSVLKMVLLKHRAPTIWAASWQNQQCGCAPSEDSDQPGHPPSLIRVFAVRMKKAWVLSYPLSAQRRLWLDWADAQVDLSLRWAHSHIVGFVMRRLIQPVQQQVHQTTS